MTTRRAGHADQRLTTCKACGRGVFAWQAWTWSADPLGICHVVCSPDTLAPADPDGSPADRPRSKVW